MFGFLVATSHWLGYCLQSCRLKTPSDTHGYVHSQNRLGDLFQLFGIHLLNHKLVCTNPSEINNVDQSTFIQKVE